MKKLDDSRLQLIFDKLSVSDLIYLGQINQDFWNLVVDELKQRFSKKRIRFCELSSARDDESVIESEEEIIIKDAQNATFILEQFGTSIRNLSITTSKITHESEVIFKLVEEQCSDSLVQFELFDLMLNFFENITKPFRNVKIVSLHGIVVELGNDQLNFGDIFPAMRRLELNNVKVNDRSKFALNFPNLKHLSVIDDINSVEIIRKNPQIRSTFLQFVNGELVKFVADHLPELEVLTLYNYRQQNDQTYDFHFGNVKYFECGFDWPENITFSDKLEELYVLLDSQDKNYVDLIEHSNGLKKLQISGDGVVDTDVMLRLIWAKLNVTEMHLVFCWSPASDFIIQLIENCEHLNQLELQIWNLEIDDLEMALREDLGHEWIINVWSADNNFNCIRLEKNTSEF